MMNSAQMRRRIPDLITLGLVVLFSATAMADSPAGLHSVHELFDLRNHGPLLFMAIALAIGWPLANAFSEQERQCRNG